ncbi:MAG: effector-associated domain EAD1-containing protein [Acidobacteriota bacterium]
MSEKVILFLAANPKETAPLRLDEELREIQENLRGASLRKQFRLEVVTSARQKDIRQALLDHKPYAVHFSGHGTIDAEIIIAKNDGSAQYVGAEALVPFFEIFSDHVECVVLCSCFTQPLAEKIGQHVDYVVGTKDALQDVSAIEYASGFYDALFAGETVEKAHSLGCNAIQWSELPGHMIPVLHIADGVSAKVRGESTTLANAWSEVKRLYARPRAAELLLSRIGFPEDRMPLFNAVDAQQFWDEVWFLLARGVVDGAGPEQVVRTAWSDYRGNKVLKQFLEG